MNDSELNKALRLKLDAMVAERTKLSRTIGSLDQQIEAARVLLSSNSSDAATKESFAAKVRRMLSAIGGTASPKQVADAITEEGFTPNGKVDLVSHVNTELYRMSKSRATPVSRVGKGRYRMTG